jgi:pSer/pThr/pTyr-binding forkhead associated (FHA) protein
VEARAYGITLLDAATGRLYEARGVRIRIGRGRECELRLDDASENLISRVHAELTVGPSGALTLHDAGSTNGTFVNDERVTAPMPVRLGDRITLGRGGPVLVVEGLGTAPKMPVARAPQVRNASRRTLWWLAALVIVVLVLLWLLKATRL